MAGTSENLSLIITKYQPEKILMKEINQTEIIFIRSWAKEIENSGHLIQELVSF